MLCASPVGVEQALKATTDGGVPEKPGLYAWWCGPHALRIVPVVPHPHRPELRLLYIGIAPSRPSSSATLRSRVVGNHLRGTTGRSTLRFSLAALLRDDLDLHPHRVGKKVLLPADENARLSVWQAKHLLVSWVVHPTPWSVEAGVIEQLHAPMNRAANGAHPFYGAMGHARAAFRAAASSALGSP